MKPSGTAATRKVVERDVLVFPQMPVQQEAEWLRYRVRSLEEEFVSLHRQYRLLRSVTSDGILDWNVSAEEVHLSWRLREMLGLTQMSAPEPQRAWLDRLHPEDRGEWQKLLQELESTDERSLTSEVRVRHADGTWHWVSLRASAYFDRIGRMLRAMCSVADITDSRGCDPLTGLHSRSSLEAALAWRIQHADQYSRDFAVLFLDLDGFKQVNDEYGHAAGDTVLVEMARRIQETLQVGTVNLASRFGGDEFVVLLSDVESQQDAVTYASCLQVLLGLPVSLGSTDVSVSASIGIVVGSRAVNTVSELIENADRAMYTAKAAGRAGCFVVPLPGPEDVV